MSIKKSWTLKNSIDCYIDFNKDFNVFLDVNGVDNKANYALNVAVEELITNTIKFNPDNSTIVINVELILSDNALELSIKDNAGAFDISAAPKTDLTKNIADIDIGGLGIELVKNMFDTCEYRYVGNSNSVRLVYNLVV